MAKLSVRDLDLVVTRRALVGALGPDAVTACAAFRAGISRASELDYFDAGGPSRGSASLRAHSACGLTHGFVGPARLACLLAVCWRDLDELDVSRVGCFVALPAPDRTLQGALAIDDPEQREQQLQAAREAHVPSEREYASAILARSLLDSPWQRLATQLVPVSAGHASVAQACLLASEQLQRGQIETALIIAMDSLLDEDTLEWLSLLRRLRSEDRPAGVVPGEACSCLVLQAASTARSQGRQALCRLRAVALDADPRHILAGQPSTGAVMADLIDEVSEPGDDPPWFIIDHNGEPTRAAEWGNTLFHLTRRHPRYRAAQVWYPAIGFGDTGAASGCVAACIAIAAWQRAYAAASRALICSAADGPERAVVCLERL